MVDIVSNLQAFIVGGGLGMVLSIPPLGPTSVLVLTSGLQNNTTRGRLIALGSGLGEAAFAGIAFWGAVFIQPYLEQALPYAQLLGAIMCLAVGTSLVNYDHAKQKPAPGKKDDDDPTGKSKDDGAGLSTFAFGLSLSCLNPGLLATWIGVTSGAASAGAFSTALAHPFVYFLGVLCGIQLWYAFVLFIVNKYGSSLPDSAVTRAMRSMGTLLLLVGASLGFGAIRSLSSGYLTK